MANSPVDIITEVMSDLTYAMEAGSEFGYRRTEDGRIEVEQYSEDGLETTIIGHLKFEEVK